MNKPVKVIGLVALAIAFVSAGIYVGETDDAPGAALLSLILAITSLVFAVKIARPKA